MNFSIAFSISVVFPVVLGYRGRWTLQELTDAIEDPSTDPELLPYLEKAIKDIMRALLTGQKIDDVAVSAPDSTTATFTVEVSYWTLQDIENAMRNPSTSPVFKPYLEVAFNQLTSAPMLGKQMDTTIIISPNGFFSANPSAVSPVQATKMSVWSFQDISSALPNPTTDSALVPYLEVAQDEILDALLSGKLVDVVIIATPVDILPEATITVTPPKNIDTTLHPNQKEGMSNSFGAVFPN